MQAVATGPLCDFGLKNTRMSLLLAPACSASGRFGGPSVPPTSHLQCRSCSLHLSQTALAARASLPQAHFHLGHAAPWGLGLALE
eukprot:804151-Alexandrium_andersonii.AAC.1